MANVARVQERIEKGVVGCGTIPSRRDDPLPAPAETLPAGGGSNPPAAPRDWWSQYAAKWSTCNVCGARAACVPDDSGERYACRQCADFMQRAGSALRQSRQGAAVVDIRT